METKTNTDNRKNEINKETETILASGVILADIVCVDNVDIEKLKEGIKKLENMKLIRSRKSKNKRVFSLTKKGKTVMINSCEDFTRTFHGIFEDFVCEKCGYQMVYAQW